MPHTKAAIKDKTSRVMTANAVGPKSQVRLAQTALPKARKQTQDDDFDDADTESLVQSLSSSQSMP